MPRRKREAPSILIIDDDKDSREALSELLTDHGYAVAAAANGAEGLTYLRSGNPAQVILLDLMMPGVDGWDFRTAQKRDAALAQIPVVVISGAGKLLDAEYAIRKPLDIEALLALLRDLVGAP